MDSQEMQTTTGNENGKRLLQKLLVTQHLRTLFGHGKVGKPDTNLQCNESLNIDAEENANNENEAIESKVSENEVVENETIESEVADNTVSGVEVVENVETTSERRFVKKIYYFDVTTLIRIADSMYGCFLADKFLPKYIDICNDENNKLIEDIDASMDFYTDSKTIEKLQKAEKEGKVYLGYSAFIERNFRIIKVKCLSDSKFRYYEPGSKQCLTSENYYGPFFFNAGALMYLCCFYDIDCDIEFVTCDRRVEEYMLHEGFECVTKI